MPAVTRKEVASNFTGYDEDALVVTTQPACGVADVLEDFPDGWSECIVRGFAKRQILATPGFPQPLHRPSKPCYRIGPTPSKGLGMFATRFIERGSLIFSERAIMIQPSCPSAPVPVDSAFSAEQHAQAVLDVWEKILESCFGRVPPANKAAFSALHNSHKHDGSGPLLGVIRTNSFGIDLPVKGALYLRRPLLNVDKVPTP